MNSAECFTKAFEIVLEREVCAPKKGAPMSDEATPKRQRSPINALKVLNQLREVKGLPKVSTRPKAIRITAELKVEITQQEIQRLFPEALTEPHYEFSDEQAKRLVKEVEFRLGRIKAGKEPAPVVDGAPASAAKRRGRPPRAAS